MKTVSLNVALATAWLATSNPARADDAPTGTFAIGAGYSSDEGFLAQARIAQPDLFHTGQGLSVSALISALREDFVLGYDVPNLLGSDLDLHAELFDRSHTYPNVFTRESAGASLELGHRLSRATRVYVRYRVEQVHADPVIAARTTTPIELGNGTVSALGAGLSYSTLDMPFLPTRGTHLELYGESADRRLGSSYDVARLHAALDHARPLGPFTLRVHGHATYVRAPGGVPLSERLFHDGRSDVIGYPIDSIGSPLGDNLEAVGRAELEVPLVPCAGLSLAGFVNAGYRYNTDAAYGATGGLLYRSVGASLIWRSPIGPLRFDLARALDGERGWVFGFGLGAL